jgi:hypothetical protein
MNNDDLYVQSFVWKRVSSLTCVRYVILMDVATHRFAVHSADFFQSDGEDRSDYFNRQFVELMLEQSPSQRCNWHASAADAIWHHDAEFSNNNDVGGLTQA